MKKNIILASLLAAGIIASSALVASPAAALSIDDLQAQIKQLLAKVASLQSQVRPAAATVQTESDLTVASVPRICKLLPARNLTVGNRGDEVLSVQEFLKTEGFLSANATGYFGPATRSALAKWQVSQGVQGVGSLGPISRERIKVWCGDTARFSASPEKGIAPLHVTFKAMVGGFTQNQYFIDFGDGTARAQISCSAPADVCIRPGTVDHTYTTNGTYIAVLYENNPGGCGPNADPRCLGAPARESAIAKEQIIVGSVACTKEYSPVCGQPTGCATQPDGTEYCARPTTKTYVNRCMMNADGATYVHEGQCRTPSVDPSSDPRCKSWYDGCNSCSRSAPGSPAMCTLRACTAEGMQKPYCTSYFDGNSGNRPPTISSFSGPTTLSLNLSGTWTIRASDPENQSLSYSVIWGDENTWNAAMSSSMPARESFVQTTTFTHTYASAGTYTVTIVVRDASGQEAKSSTTVRVGTDGGTACTLQYDPVCGRPTGCANTCPPGMYCAMMCQQHDPVTYGNRCQLNAAGAEYLYDGQCQANTY